MPMRVSETLRIYVLRVKQLRDIGTPIEIINFFGSKDNFLEAVGEMETQLYLAEA